MTIAEMRLKISEVYPGKKWHERCSKMPNSQVVAVYKSLEKRNFDRNYGAIEENHGIEQNEEFHQLDIFEYMMQEKLREEELKVKNAYEFKEDDHRFFGRINGKYVEFESEDEYLRVLQDEAEAFV